MSVVMESLSLCISHFLAMVVCDECNHGAPFLVYLTLPGYGCM